MLQFHESNRTRPWSVVWRDPATGGLRRATFATLKEDQAFVSPAVPVADSVAVAQLFREQGKPTP